MRLTVTGLACERGGRRVFEGLSFGVERGGALLLEGRNGAGKSSLLRLLAGLLEPAAGTIDNPFTVGLAGHAVSLKPGGRLRDELGFWARLDGRAAGVEAGLAAFGLAALADLPAGLLSSGQQHRASLARVAISGAGLWLLDEPGVGLDAASLGLLADAVARHRAGGGAVIAATHMALGFDAPGRLVLG